MLGAEDRDLRIRGGKIGAGVQGPLQRQGAGTRGEAAVSVRPQPSVSEDSSPAWPSYAEIFPSGSSWEKGIYLPAPPLAPPSRLRSPTSGATEVLK